MAHDKDIAHWTQSFRMDETNTATINAMNIVAIET
jgi:hypothetical protein